MLIDRVCVVPEIYRLVQTFNRGSYHYRVLDRSTNHTRLRTPKIARELGNRQCCRASADVKPTYHPNRAVAHPPAGLGGLNGHHGWARGSITGRAGPVGEGIQPASSGVLIHQNRLKRTNLPVG